MKVKGKTRFPDALIPVLRLFEVVSSVEEIEDGMYDLGFVTRRQMNDCWKNLKARNCIKQVAFPKRMSEVVARFGWGITGYGAEVLG